ncbi:MAG: tripartite tricarboxylate transporter TctB family protein, partial [Planctomycetales bacterium]|nr:tripartite tricarboxylate transporter TctB family protein [Planctomycetales bacterium]
MEQSRYNNTWRVGDELDTFLAETDEKFGQLLTSEAMQSVHVDPFDRWLFPNLLLGVLGLSIVGLVVQRLVQGPAPAPAEVAAAGESSSSVTSSTITSSWRLVVVVLAALAYVVTAETIGFILASSLMVWLLLTIFEVRWWRGVLLAAVLCPMMYGLFGTFLRIPLPRGWLGF